MIKGVIFDLDGTLLNTLEDLTKAINETMDDLSLPRQTITDTRNKIGSGFKNLLKQCVPENYSDNQIDEAVKSFTGYYDKCYYEKTKPYTGIKELVDWCLDNNIKVGVNSNKKDLYTKKLIKLNFPGINEDYVFGKRDNCPIKPDPCNNNDILKNMGLGNEEILYIGDSAVDIKTARNSKMKVVAVTWGYRDTDVLKENNPDFIVNKPGEITDIIKKENGEKIMVEQTIEYRYDTQLLIEGENLDEDAINDYFVENFKGDCLLAVGDEDLIKIHYHTNEPWKVLEYCRTLGEIYDIVVEDMDRQSRGLKG